MTWSAWRRIRCCGLCQLEIKTPLLLAGTTLGGRSITAIYSNVELSGCRRNTESIFRDSDFCKHRQPAALFLLFGEMRWYLALHRKYQNGNIERNFGGEAERRAGVPWGPGEWFSDRKRSGSSLQRFFESFTIPVLCWLWCNLDRFSRLTDIWAGLVCNGRGVLHPADGSWLLMRKRRNLWRMRCGSWWS